MKRFIFLPLLVFFSFAFGQTANTLNPKSKAKVKQIRSSIYTDDQGRAVMIRQGEAYQPEYHLQIEVIRFDSSERMIEKRIEDSTGKIIQQQLYEYDKNGNHIKSVEMVSGHKSLSTIKTWRNDTLIQRQYFDGNDRLFSTWTYEFDPAKKLQTTTEWIDGKKDDVYHTYFDKHGLQVKDSQFSSLGQLNFYWEGSYDRNKKLVKKKSWARDSVNYDCKKYRYDKKGRVIEMKEFDKTNALIRTTSIEYDSKGNPIHVTKFSPRTNERYSEKTEYSYDKNGNWLSRKTSDQSPGVESSKTFRQIEYWR